GNRNREVVQRCEGVRLHRARRRRQGRLRPLQRDLRRWAQVARRGREGRVRHGRGRKRPRGAERGRGLVADKEEKIEIEGDVIEAFRSGMYKVSLEGGHEALAYTSGRMRRYRIRINPGDRVKVELSPYDLTRGRIVYR